MIEIVETQAHGHDGLAMIDAKGAVWVTFSRPWWCIASWFWLSPGEKKIVQCKNKDGSKTRIRAFRAADRHVRVYGGKS